MGLEIESAALGLTNGALITISHFRFCILNFAFVIGPPVESPSTID